MRCAAGRLVGGAWRKRRTRILPGDYRPVQNEFARGDYRANWRFIVAVTERRRANPAPTKSSWIDGCGHGAQQCCAPTLAEGRVAVIGLGLRWVLFLGLPRWTSASLRSASAWRLWLRPAQG